MLEWVDEFYSVFLGKMQQYREIGFTSLFKYRVDCFIVGEDLNTVGRVNKINSKIQTHTLPLSTFR